MAPQDDGAEDSMDFGDAVDTATFEQILEMDGEEDREFSQSIVFDFFDQARATFVEMDESMKTKDLQTLSDKGHFLKGSSATLGFTKIKDECEKIQNWGRKKDESGMIDEPDSGKCLRLIQESIMTAKRAFEEVEGLMKRFYHEE